MKKLSFILCFVMLTALTWSQTAPPATTCGCNPTGWQPATATINNQTMTVNCGHQFSLKCNDKITIKQFYKCTGTCTAKYKAVLKNSAGTVIANYPSFTFPWSYQFTAAGNYSLEITAICGTISCTPPCRYYFTVTCPTACDCDNPGWKPFTATISGGTPQTVNCGHQFGVPKNKPITIKGVYSCKGNCAAKYKAVLKNNVTGAVVQSYSPFTFPWTYTFATAGNYKLEITPYCGDKRCQPCVFYFTVN